MGVLLWVFGFFYYKIPVRGYPSKKMCEKLIYVIPIYLRKSKKFMNKF